MSTEELERDGQEEMHAPQAEQGAPDADLEALQAEVVELRRQVAGGEVEKEVWRTSEGASHRGRRWAVGLLILLASIVLAGANVTFWLRAVVLNTDAWVRTVGPLSKNEVIVNTLSSYVVDELYQAVDVPQLTQEVLPAELRFVSGPLSSVVQELLVDVVATVVASDEFNAVWVAVNRAAHQAVMGVLRGGGPLLALQDGQLVLDFTTITNFLQGTLDMDALGLFLGEDWGRFVLLESHQVAVVQQVLDVLNTLGLVLPLLAVVVFVVAWLVSLWRRRTLLWIGVAVAITMVVSLVLFWFARPVALASMADVLVRTVAGEMWDVLTRGLIVQTLLLLVVGLLIAVGAWLAGPHPQAVAARAWVGGLRETRRRSEAD